MMNRMKYLAILISIAFCVDACGDENVAISGYASDPPLRYWRGNIHTHSLWSDGDDFPEMIAEWYRTHDYNFLALTDHNVLSQGVRFMKASQIESRGGSQVIEKYRRQFGEAWVESKGEKGTEEYSIRLKPLDEFRALVEERGKFIMIPGEEISDSVDGKPLHMNATNLAEVLAPVGGQTIREAMSNNLRAVEQQAKRAGREILVHLNHPNFGYAVTAEDIAHVVQERFFEVFNGHPAVGQLGDDKHPSIERMWDIANTLRIGELNADPIYGVATDDSHNYHGKPNGSYTGRGWVMVQSRYLTPERIVKAMKRGDFYASSGVALTQVTHNLKDKTFKLSIAKQAGETYTTKFIGTRRAYDASSSDRGGDRVTRTYSKDIGEVFAEIQGETPEYRFRGDELYVRAIVTSSAGHHDPSFDGQKKQAWTQPIVLK